MVGAVLAVLVALQQPQATVQVDRSEVPVGGTVTVTLSVRASASIPIEIAEPTFDGFDVIDRRERSQVSVADGIRVTVRDIQLRARRPGRLMVPAFRLQQEGAIVESTPIAVTVTGSVPAPPVLTPRVRSMIQRAQPPSEADAAGVVVSVLPSAERVMLGEQLDLVVAAWFPREVRERLRAPPTMLPPDVRGAWGYAGAAPTSLVASRESGGRTYDLFIYHEIVFALTPGDLEVGPATVSYNLPVSGAFLSREVRQEAESQPFLVAVQPPPNDTDAGIMAAEDLTLKVEAPVTDLGVGDAVVVTVSVSGVGNVALWPEPELRWPRGIQAYQQRATVDVTSDEGRIGGTKVFEYLVVADTAGTHRLPPPRLQYFDLAGDERRTVEGEAIVFVTPEGPRPPLPVRAVLPLLAHSPWRDAGRLPGRWPPWLMALIAIGPPILASARCWWLRLGRRRPRAAAGPRPPGDGLSRLEADVRNALDRLVPGADITGVAALTDALVAAGVEVSLAEHAARVRDRLRSALFGPAGVADVDELVEEVQAVLSGLRGDGGSPGHRRTLGLILVCLALPSVSEAQSIEQLWEAGAARSVADSMLVRLRSAPDAAEDWYNLGLAWERMGATARARAAWLRSARLAPRLGPIRRVAGQVRTADRTGRGLLWVAPVTPREAFAFAAVFWCVGWMFVAFQRWRLALVSLVLAGACGAWGEVVSARYRAPVAFIAASGTPLREAPFGPAPSQVALAEAVAVRIAERRGAWQLVGYGTRLGWVHESETVEP